MPPAVEGYIDVSFCDVSLGLASADDCAKFRCLLIVISCQVDRYYIHGSTQEFFCLLEGQDYQLCVSAQLLTSPIASSHSILVTPLFIPSVLASVCLLGGRQSLHQHMSIAPSVTPCGVFQYM
jgi:hypothetical protein